MTRALVAGMLSLFLYTGCTTAIQPPAPQRAAERQPSKLRPVELGEPFTLLVGDSVQVGPEGLQVVLRSMSSDSGCFLPDDCSYMVFNGSLALVAGGQGHLSRLDADFRPGDPASVTFAGYRIEVLSTTGPARLSATLRVTQE